jgi:conjugative transfer region protein TrbK
LTRALGIKATARAVGFAAVAAVIIATLLHLRHNDAKPAGHIAVSAASPSEPLARELSRCRAIGMAAQKDPSCSAAWAENRRRFFTYAPRSASPPRTLGASTNTGQPQ